MHNVTETVVFTPDVTVPDDGVDFRTEASLEGAFTALSNRTQWLKALLTGTLTGQDVSFRKNAFVSLALQVGGLLQCLGNLTVAGISVFTGGSTFNGVVSFNALVDALSIQVATLVTTGNTTIGNSLVDVCDIYASCNLRGNNQSQGTFVTSGAFNCAGGGQFSSPVSCTANGRLYRPGVVGPQSGGGTLSAQASNLYYFPTVTADQAFSVSSGDQNGDEIEIVTASAAHLIDIYQPGGITLIEAGMIAGGVAGHSMGIRLKKIAGAYVVLNRTPSA